MKINKKVKMLIIAFILGVFVICLTGSLVAYIPSRMSEKHTNDIIELYFEDTGYDIQVFDEKWQAQPFEITSDFGHEIPVYYLTSNSGYDNKTIILVHWHESNHIAMYPIAELFLDEGWNVVLYDQRAHGKNTAKTVTFGYMESNDLKQVVAFAKDKAGSNPVGVLGQSMGAATIGYYLGSDEAQEDLAFAVMDCPYSGMHDVIVGEISNGKAPLLANAAVSLGSTFCKAIYGYSFEDVNIAARVSNSNTPLLILHSKADQKCPYIMAEEIFQAIPHDNKMFISYESSEHLFSFWDEPDRYKAEIIGFINLYIE